MKLFFLTALLLVSLVASSSIKSPRIIGGSVARAGQFPFAAAINSQTSSGTYFCGGALLSDQWILSSGSCVDGGVLFQIRLGLINLQASGPEVLRVSTDMYFLHPEYNPLNLDNDIGLIKLRLPITFSDYIQPISVASRNLVTYALVTAIGWGQTSEQAAGLSNDLRSVQLSVLSNEECRLVFGYQITDNMVCIDGNYNQGICLGDTGGPLIQYVNAVTATLVGVASFVSSNGCESIEPSGCTRVSPYIDWISNVTQNNL